MQITKGEACITSGNKPLVRLIGTMDRLLDTWVNRLSDISIFITAIAVLAMMALITVEVVGRDAFTVSTKLADEVGAYLLVLMTYLGLAYTLRKGGHIRITTLLDRLPLKVQNIVEFCTSVLNFAVSIVLAWWAWQLVVDSYTSDLRSITWTRTSLYIPQLPMAIGISILVIQTASVLFKQLKKLMHE